MNLLESYQNDTTGSPTPDSVATQPEPVKTVSKKPAKKPSQKQATQKQAPLMVLVHPGSACGSANDLLGRYDAQAGRDGLVIDLNDWNGHIIVADGELSDEIPSYRLYNTAILNALQRAEANGLVSGRVFACDNMTENWPSVVFAQIEKIGLSKDTPIKLTGAWYLDDDSSGCVNSMERILKSNGYNKAYVSDFAIRDPSGDDEGEDW